MKFSEHLDSGQEISVEEDKKMEYRELIARRAAQEFKDGYVVNLGFGIPVLAASYIPEGVEVILQGEKILTLRR